MAEVEALLAFSAVKPPNILNNPAAADSAGVPVYRVTAPPIGCSLAESAETAAYGAYLSEAAEYERALHIVYINTSLVTKAKAHALVPTLTCTSSNVVRSVLQAAAQVPDINIFFGPDTYMGHNLAHLFASLGQMDAAKVAAVHPAHTPESVRALAERFHYFEQGTCIVHHMFGAEVVAQVPAGGSPAVEAGAAIVAPAPSQVHTPELARPVRIRIDTDGVVAQVFDQHGAAIGSTADPAGFELPRGELAVRLTLRADDHEAQEVSVTPSADRSLRVVLPPHRPEPGRARAPAPLRRGHGRRGLPRRVAVGGIRR